MVGERCHDRQLEQREARWIDVATTNVVGVGGGRPLERHDAGGVDMEPAEVEVTVEDGPYPEVVAERVGADLGLVQVRVPRLRVEDGHEDRDDHQAREPVAREPEQPARGGRP